MTGQVELLDYLTSIEPKRESELKKGMRIYKIVLDVVETGIIEFVWKFNGGYGYSAKKDSSIYATFWSPDINKTVFTDGDEAYSRAEKLRNIYKVIRAKDMIIVKEKNFVNVKGKKRTETVKLLEGNMVYLDKWPCYPFLEKLETEKQAEKRYKKCIDEIVNNINNMEKVETDESLPMQDMYLARTGKWSRYDYTHFNHPVLVGIVN